MVTQFRPGRYIRQPNHYSAFMPEPLPPVPPVMIDRFVEADLLTEITGCERYRVWQYFPYVRLFSDVGWAI